MAFGLDAGISRQTNSTVQVAEQVGPTGVILDMTTHGGVTETTEEVYIDSGSFESDAINGQTGTEVVSAHNLIESNSDYCRAQKTTREAQSSGS